MLTDCKKIFYTQNQQNVTEIILYFCLIITFRFLPLAVSSIFCCRHFTVVSGKCFIGELCKQYLHTIPFFLSQYFLLILSSFDFILQILCVFSVNKIGRHIDVNCQYATWMTDLIFDSDFHNKK